MEPVSLVASVVTLLNVCGNIGELVTSLRDAPRELCDLARTVDSLKLIIKEAKSSLHDLSALIGDVSDPKTARSGVRISVAKWPFKKKKATTILQDLARARDGIAILIACDTSQSSQLAAENISLVGKEIQQQQSLLLQATQTQQLENSAVLAKIFENTEHLLSIEQDTLRLRRAFQRQTAGQLCTILDISSEEMGSLSGSSSMTLLPLSSKESWQSGPLQSPSQATCPSGCICLCHSTQYAKSPDMLRYYLGKLFATYTGSLTAAPTCSDTLCRSQCALDLRAFYASPTWFFSKAIYLMFQRTRLGEWHLALKVRVVSVDGMLFDRVEVGDYTGVRSMLARHEVSPDEVDQRRYQTALHYAIDRGRPDLCELLLSFGADASIEDSSGISAQHLAWLRILSNFKSPLLVAELKRLFSTNVSSDCIDLSPLHERVIRLKSNSPLCDLEWPTFSKYINACDKVGRTLLSWAAERDDEHTIRYLLRHNAELEIHDHNYWTPLRYASLALTANAMRVLLEQGASVAPESRYQTNALHDVAYHKRDLEYVKLLEAAGCLLDHVDSGGNTPLAKACYADNDIVADYLLHRGANPHNLDSTGMSCMAKATQSGANRVLKLLLAFKAEYHHIDKHGCSIIHTAAASEAVTEETLEILISEQLQGLDIGLRNKAGNTAAQVFGMRPDVTGAIRAKFRELLASIVPSEPQKEGPDHPDTWLAPVTIM